MQIPNQSDLLLFLFLCAQIIWIPHVKVEEQFHFNAVFDLIYNPHTWSHLSFQPFGRSMIPGLVLSILVYPLSAIVHTLPSISCPSLIVGTISRIILAMLFVGSFAFLRRKVHQLYSPQSSLFLLLLTLSQFHLCFYASRPLGNTFALIITILGYAFWLSKNHASMILCAAFTCIVVRFDLAVFWASILLSEILHLRPSRALSLIPITASAILFALILTLGIDSYFYGKPIWPELNAFWFNIVENKSHLYGISPFSWYFANALPRSLLFTLPWFLLSIPCHPRLFLRLGIPILVAIAIFSLLPHKELRFIFPAIPIINLLSAITLHTVWTTTSSLRPFFRLAIISSLLLNGLATLFSLWVSSWNYPGGLALAHTHHLLNHTQTIHVHIWHDLLSSMTGATRFGYCHTTWQYSDYTISVRNTTSITHILTEFPHEFTANFKTIAIQHAFDKISWQDLRNIPKSPVETIKRSAIFSPRIHIMERTSRSEGF